MDGNGRWAKKRGLPRSAGHTAGAANFRTITRYASSIGVKYLTLYAFSTENWNRPAEEVSALMRLFRQYLEEALSDFMDENIRVRFLGDVSAFSPELQALLLEQTLEYTAAEYCSEVQTLYDLWCAGDEAALRQSLEEDIPDLTAEEAALYEEYLDAMIIQRNKDMLDVATSYLESGDTVFFAVGLAHLLQENGLVDTLQDAGYTVERVIYS